MNPTKYQLSTTEEMKKENEITKKMYEKQEQELLNVSLSQMRQTLGLIGE